MIVIDTLKTRTEAEGQPHGSPSAFCGRGRLLELTVSLRCGLLNYLEITR